MLLVTYDSDTTDYDSFNYESDLKAEAPMCLDFLVGANLESNRSKLLSGV